MDKLTVSAVGDGNPLHHSMSDQQPTADEKALELLRGADQNRAAAADAQMSARMKLEQLDRSVDIKELDAYFMTLEEERRSLQDLLEEQKQEHELDLKAIERERLQERLEWELMMQEREEALRSALMSVAITKHKMKKGLLARLVGTSTASAPEPKTNALQEMAKLQERVRSTEMGKQEKALLKAEAAEKKRQQKALQQAQKEAAKAEKEATKAQKEAAKAEKQAEKEAAKAEKEEATKAQKEAAKAQKEEAAKAQKEAGKNRAKALEVENDSNSSQQRCSTQSDIMPAEQDRKEKKTVGCFGFLFKRRKATKTNKAATEQ